MKGGFCFLAGFLMTTALPAAQEVEKVVLSPASNMTRAEIYVWKGVKRPEAVLVLSPGYNGSGEGLVRQAVWQRFAEDHKLGLVGLSFASDVKQFEDRRGYYYASQGSGEILLEGLKEVFRKELPLLLYGFSGGAHFSSRFAEWKPEKVLSWCAYSAAWWDEPQRAEVMPPGIVVCGDQDERYGASMIYFKQGRAKGKPWLWVSVPNNGHSPHAPIETFIRDYFEAILKRRGKEEISASGLWVDVDREREIDPASEHPAVTAWLPDKKLLAQWKELHQP